MRTLPSPWPGPARRLAFLPVAFALTASVSAQPWDTFSDTWVATDALGRSLPNYAQTGPPRPDKTVAIFYFLWHGAHVQGGPYDISKILAADPAAMRKPDSPLWGPLHAPHHWGESIFGYYLTDDAAVLRKHAQMLADAGVDAIVFDVSNQITYKPYYMALLRVFADVNQLGGSAPKIAFLCPFWDPDRVVPELYRDLYQPGLFADLWFRWEGKPLILADPARLQTTEANVQQNTATRLEPGHTLGQTFTVDQPFEQAGGRFPTWNTPDAAMTLSLRRAGPGGDTVARRRFELVPDNAWLLLDVQPAQPPGTYCLEMSDPRGTVGWWSHTGDVLPRGQAHADGRPVAGDRTLRWTLRSPAAHRLREFFTFRKPQPDYFRGPTGPNQWSWLEVHPQHVFTNAVGHKEQMSVGVAQNAVGNRLATLSEPGARGRNFHRGTNDPAPDAIWHGYNAAEQWARALREDPRLIFITGWNEWIAGRFSEFNGVRAPVMFVDQFNQGNSRDVEPMRGGHGDTYYYQMIAHIRRFKGVRPLPAVIPKPITVDGRFDDWQAVTPEFRDTVGDPVRRRHPGWGKAGPYVNDTGRNDLVAAKVSWDAAHVYFYARTREPLTPPAGSNWMLLFIDCDRNPTNGWLGYDRIVNRTSPGGQSTTLETQQGRGYRWGTPQPLPVRCARNELELAIPRSALGLGTVPAALDFKWADNIRQTGDWSDFTLDGDAAPNDRFNYRARLRGGSP
ncbi:MAG: hypothetical protein JXQ71_01205 [Verrucomicrobia bacterium]|nr:hypothetical protein [Verrucomicrobiota bacterium]